MKLIRRQNADLWNWSPVEQLSIHPLDILSPQGEPLFLHRPQHFARERPALCPQELRRLALHPEFDLEEEP